MPRMPEREPVSIGRIRTSPEANSVLRDAREIATNLHHPLGLPDIIFACLLNEGFRGSVEEKIGVEKTDDAFRAASEALSMPAAGNIARLLSTAKWLHGKGPVGPEDLYLAASRLSDQHRVHAPRRHIKRAV